MSLKGFYILFIALLALLSVGFGLWTFGQYANSSSMGLLAAAVAALVFALVLIEYRVWFLRNSRASAFSEVRHTRVK